MSIVIGGCGSSGTSLLRQILNRHSQVYIAPETHVFCKNKLYIDWNQYKSHLLRRSILGLRSSGMRMYTGLDLTSSDFDMVRPNVKQILSESHTLEEFANTLFGKVMMEKGKQVWGEKTPNNIYHFREILEQLPVSKCVFMTRNPYDMIASLVERGHSISLAVCRCLLSQSFGVAAAKYPNVYILKYEDLTQVPQQVLKNLCDFLEIEFQTAMLNEGKASPDDGTTMKGWTLDESKQIEARAVGRFAKAPQEIQIEILHACQALYIKEHMVQSHTLTCTTLAQTNAVLGYTSHASTENPTLIARRLAELKALRIQRKLRLYPEPFGNFPLAIT